MAPPPHAKPHLFRHTIHAILDTMLDGFRLAATDDDTKTLEEEKEREAVIQKALDLFAKYFFHLWW
ncbi:MAG: hypothetical protein IJ775_06515 [Muribaculaceae bacterium]|nr:hypothetical protein [Muribaculaceae bacterium]